MAYFLIAIIASKSDMEDCECRTVGDLVDLPQFYCMLPITMQMLSSIDDHGDSSSYIPGFLYLKTPILDWIERYFRSGTFALVENDTGGGVGDQSALIWRDGKCIFGPIHTETNIFQPYTDKNVPLGNAAINQSLRLLGVTKGAEDEFEALGLGKFRNTEEWLSRDA